MVFCVFEKFTWLRGSTIFFNRFTDKKLIFIYDILNVSKVYEIFIVRQNSHKTNEKPESSFYARWGISSSIAQPQTQSPSSSWILITSHLNLNSFLLELHFQTTDSKQKVYQSFDDFPISKFFAAIFHMLQVSEESKKGLGIKNAETR